MSHVPGFSKRFRKLLSYTSMSEVRRHGFYSRGAELVGVSRNTFKAYCENDFSPNYEHLLSMIEILLVDGVPGDQDVRHVAAWLMFGDEILESPFSSDIDTADLDIPRSKSHV